MQDYAAFCRQRLRACFHRRRKYPLGSEDRACAVKDARDFIRYYRGELAWQEIERMAQTLEIAAPVKRPPKKGVNGRRGGSLPMRWRVPCRTSERPT